MKRESDGLELGEVEALIYRLFSEKQLAMAMLALLMVANLMTAQFLLLRSSTAASGGGAPSPDERLDVYCAELGPSTWNGDPLPELGDRVVVLHVDASMRSCVQAVGGARRLLLGTDSP